MRYQLNPNWSTPTKILFAIASAGKPIRQVEIARRAGVSVQLLKSYLPELIQDELVFCTVKGGVRYFTTHPLFSEKGLEVISYIEPFTRRANDFMLPVKNKEKSLTQALEMFFEMHILS